MATAATTTTTTSGSTHTTTSSSNADDHLPPAVGTRYVLQAEEELRIEVPFAAHNNNNNNTINNNNNSNNNNQQSTCTVVALQKGSCEIWGLELATAATTMTGGMAKPVVLYGGGFTLALFTWHGCVVDIAGNNNDDNNNNNNNNNDETMICYTTDETNCNIAYVNTHAQLEALRDQAAAAAAAAASTSGPTTSPSSSSSSLDGPRVLICGPTETGKTTLWKRLIAYACKVGRTPLAVDLDIKDNMLSIPGTLAACPMSLSSSSSNNNNNYNDATTTPTTTAATLSMETHVTTGIPPGGASSLVLWHGSAHTCTAELYKAQVTALAHKIQQRWQQSSSSSSSSNNINALERSSGMIVNTGGTTKQGDLDLLLHAIQALSITVVLVMGDDRLYSMLKSKVAASTNNNTNNNTTTTTKVIKLPRSGGVVTREATFLRKSRMRAVKRYFYGGLVEAPHTNSTNNNNTKLVPELTPFLLQLPTDQITIYKFTSISLSASLLPVAATQTTEAVQLEQVDLSVTTAAALEQHLLAVCHPRAVANFQQSGQASDLYLAGVAGFCSVERVVDDRIHLLCPCAGSLPSHVLLLGDVTWME